MRGYRESGRSPWVLVLLLLIGALLGSLVGTSFSKTVPILKATQAIGFPTTTFNLGVLQFSLGLQLHFNLAALAGVVLAWLIYRRL